MSDRQPDGDPEFSHELTMRAIHPRADKDYVLMVVARALDNADPSERVSVQITRFPNVGYGEKR